MKQEEGRNVVKNAPETLMGSKKDLEGRAAWAVKRTVME